MGFLFKIVKDLRVFRFSKNFENNPSFGVQLYTNPVLRRGYETNYGDSYATLL